MNLASTIIPKSDQLNADDLIAGPRILTITGIKAGSTPEQPVSIEYEGGEGRPWKPCKSMRRVLVAIWGADGSAYVGRRVQLYRDDSVTFGPEKTGGIRISHMSGLDEPKQLALTQKRGKRAMVQILPLKDDRPEQLAALLEKCKAHTGFDEAKFWTWLGVKTLAEVPADKLDAALRSLANKLRELESARS
jgi:hypothetical protein